MAGAEGLGGVDLDGAFAGPHALAIVRAVDDEPAGADRRQAFQRFRHPVDVRQVLDPDVGAGKDRLDERAELFTEDRLLVGLAVDGGLPDVLTLVDLHGGQGTAVLLENRAHRIEKPGSVAFRPGGEELNLAQGRSCLR